MEWLNVSGGADAAPDWTLAHNQLVREGFVWVGVSAQRVGVDALKSAAPPRGDPVRYANLSHPGDSYSYDIFSQAGQAIRANASVMLSGLKPKQIIAIGESQSAGRLVTYIDAVHPLVEVYDGFLVHSRMGGGSPLSQAPQPSVPIPTPAPIRDDIGVPVLVFQTETDVSFTNLNARQPDSSMYRLWEVAEPRTTTSTGSASPLRHRRRSKRGRGAHVDAEPHQPADPSSRAARRSTPGPPRTSSARPSTGSTVGRQRRRTADRTPPPDHRG